MAPKVKESHKVKNKFEGKRWRFKGVKLDIPSWVDENYVKYITNNIDKDRDSDSAPLFVPLEVIRRTSERFHEKPNFEHVNYLKDQLDQYVEKDLKGIWVKNFVLEIIKLLWNFKHGRIPYSRMGYGLSPKALKKFRNSAKVYNSR